MNCPLAPENYEFYRFTKEANKKVWERTQLAILKQLPTHFKANHEKGVGTLFPRVPAPLHPCTSRYFLNLPARAALLRSKITFWFLTNKSLDREE